MALLGPDNAIGWAQVQLKGGAGRVLTHAASWGALMAAGVVAWGWLAQVGGPPGAMFTATMALLVWQAANLLLIGGGRVAAVIRRDIDQGMIESHRLMPIAPADAVVGYVFGGLAPTLALAAATFLVGAATASAAGIALHRWVVPNVLLLGCALFLWVVIAFAALVSKSAGGAVYAMLFPFFHGGLAGLVPGLSALFNPIVGASIFDMRTRTAEIGWSQAAAGMAQLAVGAHFFVAACRKYRRPDVQAMTPGLSLSLLATWVAITALGLSAWDDFRPAGWRQEEFAPDVRLTAAMVGSLCLAILPVWSAVQARVEWRRRAAADEPDRHPQGVLATSALATLIVLLLAAVAPEPPGPYWTGPVVRSAVAMFAALVGLGYVHAIARRGGGETKVPQAAWVALVWLAPVAFDLGTVAMEMPILKAHEEDPFGLVSTASPLGTLIATWTAAPVSTTPGLLIHVAAAAVPFGLYHATTRWHLRKSAEAP